jgi:integrase
VSLYRRGGVWWLYIVHNGRRYRRSTGESEKQGALRIHDELKAELWKLKPSRGTFHAALDAWAVDADPADRYRVGKLKKAYDDRPLHRVTADSLIPAIPATSAGTFNRYTNLITAALNKSRKAGLIEATPHLEKRKQPAGRIRWLTQQEWKRLDKELPEHLKPLARFALATGLRQRNVTHLEWSQVDMGRRVAWIHPDQAKARRAIGIPLSNAAIAVLKAQHGKDDRWVFPYRGKPIGKIKTAWHEALTRAKIENFTWHDLRHTWASWHVQAGTPLHVLKEMGGWATMQMVTRYAHLAPEHLAEFANNARPRRVARRVA